MRMQNYRGLCRSCALKGRTLSEDHRRKISEAKQGKTFSKEHCRNISEARKARAPPSEETRRKISEGNKGKIVSEETRQKISSWHQSISYEDWESFAKDGEYCHKFNNDCRERNREKYERRCFICGKDEDDNGERLSVHHVDMSKSQGCDGEEWKLVPLCHSCHSRAHSKTWTARIEYLMGV